MTNTELKVESQSSTIPRAGRSGKSLPLSATANIQSSGSSQQLTDAVASEAPSVTGKRRSAAHSYRMQTESSLAKVNASKESLAESSGVKGGVSKKESYTMMRFPSTPNITAEDREVDGSVESVQNSQRRSSVEGADESQGLQMDGRSSGGTASGVDIGRLIDGSDRTLMPPPLSTSVPQSYHATFIAKAAKHRRTTMPESLARSRELLAGALAKHHRLSDASATDDDDSAPSSSSSACMLATLDASPLEPPERDGHKTRVSSAHITDASAHNLSNVECGSVTGTKVEHSDSASSAGSSVTSSPQILKIGHCVSPVRPQSASTNIYRRQLPPDPRLSASHTTAASDSIVSSASSQVSMARSASAESGMRLVESSLEPDVSKQHTSPMQRSPVPQQDGGQRLISSKTETRLVLDPEHSITENLTSTAQQTIINEIARFCTERRMSADRASQQEQRAAETGTIAHPAGHTRQQWEKTKPCQPLIIKSQSNSSISQTASSSACDSMALADVSSLSKNSVGSMSSSSGFTQDTAAVAASVSDTVISYVSVQMPTKLALRAAGSAADVVTSQSMPHTASDVTKGSIADEDEQTSLMKPPEYTDSSSAQPASERSSDG